MAEKRPPRRRNLACRWRICCPIGRRCRASARAAACKACLSTSAPLRRYSAKVRGAPRSCSSASSRVTPRISRVIRSWAPPDACSIARSGGGIDRRTVYLTNVVKHFKWEPRGKRRIHDKPNAAEIAHAGRGSRRKSRSSTRVLVALGATAAQALLGKAFRSRGSGGTSSSLAPIATATVHPSSILRARDEKARREEMRQFVADLKKVAAMSPGARIGS